MRLKDALCFFLRLFVDAAAAKSTKSQWGVLPRATSLLAAHQPAFRACKKVDSIPALLATFHSNAHANTHLPTAALLLPAAAVR